MRTMTDLPAEPLWATLQSLPISPKAAAAGRELTAEFMARARLDAEHVSDVVLVVSELVTNAIKYGANGRRNICLDVEVWSKWTLITVDDRDPHVYEAAPERGGDDLPESGRGLLIVRAYAERFWWDQKLISKTANAVICRTGITLTDEDNALLDGLESESE